MQRTAIYQDREDGQTIRFNPDRCRKLFYLLGATPFIGDNLDKINPKIPVSSVYALEGIVLAYQYIPELRASLIVEGSEMQIDHIRESVKKLKI